MTEVITAGASGSSEILKILRRHTKFEEMAQDFE
jgi:hypothetical protein